MTLPAVSIAWAFLQISFGCSLALAVAWLLRGRRPQWVSAILAGTCIASLLLAMIAVVPVLQWTIAIDNDLKTQRPTKVIHAASQESERQTGIVLEQKVAPSLDDTSSVDTIRFAGTNGIDMIRNLLSQYLQNLDREVRVVEQWQRPVIATRNFGLVAFMLSGLSVMSILWYCSWLYMRRILRFSEPVQEPEILDCVAFHAKAFGLAKIPSVRESNQVPIGATVGWRYVTVLLHTDWREWSMDERTAVIAHEIAHASRQDFAWVIISSWTRILLFFHPMVHALVNRLRLEQELAADQLAAGAVGNAKAYGRALASLALRSQQSLGASNAKLDSMLAAGQICVTRRVTMLRQGSLKPIRSRSRWTYLAIALVAFAAVPLAGLRGITQELQIERKTTGEGAKEGQSTDVSKALPLSKEFLAAFPPVEFKGSMIYRPGRFRAGEFGPEAAWLQEWFAISALGQPLPDQATIFGECNGIIRWTDEERQHGRFELGAGFREGDCTSPGQLTKLADPFNPRGRMMRTVASMEIEGRTAMGVTNSSSSDEVQKWLIDDERGYFLGSREQAVQFVRGQRFALDAIPETFRKEYLDSAFAMVYTNCDQWPSKLEAFYKGSPRQNDFKIFGLQPPTEILKDIKQFGVFIDGCRVPACNIRTVMTDDRAAKRFAAQAKMLIDLGKIALESLPAEIQATEREVASSFLDTMTITAIDAEVLFQFDLWVPSLVRTNGPLETDGWIRFNALTKNQGEGSIVLQPQMSFSTTPSLLAQTLDASDYRGKTVTLELDLQCNDDARAESGAFVWASKHERSAMDIYSDRVPRHHGSPFVGHRVLAGCSSASNGTSSWNDVMKMERRLSGAELASDAPTRPVAVTLTVPDDAEHLSFGCYSKNTEIRISNVKFTVAGASTPTSPSSPNDLATDVPYNVLIVPGDVARNSPTALNFEPSESKRAEIASRPTGSESR